MKVLKGEFDNFELLKDAASKADIVVRKSYRTIGADSRWPPSLFQCSMRDQNHAG